MVVLHNFEVKSHRVNMYSMMYSFFWVILWCLNFICLHFRTLCLFHLHRWCKQEE